MKLFLISQTENNDYDTFDSAVVAAPDEDTARLLDPGSFDGKPYTEWDKHYSTWCRSPEQVSVRYLGEADPDIGLGVICASFNAG